VKVEDESNHRYRAVSKNVSETGAGFQSLSPLGKGELLLVGFDLPDLSWPLRLSAEVVSCKPSEETHGAFEVGVRFLSPSMDELVDLKAALAAREGGKF
jgi:hypothetical protein